jgi:beta-glucanase (GH16 family)
MDWEPGYIRFYFDGKVVGTVTNAVVASPQAIIIDYSAGLWGGAIHPNVPMHVDYVRVWQRVVN